MARSAMLTSLAMYKSRYMNVIVRNPDNDIGRQLTHPRTSRELYALP